MIEHPQRFATVRTRRFHAKTLRENEKRTIARIENFGCEVMQVTSGAAGPGWSYTVGVYDTCGMPEIITVGLPENTALFLLNEAAKRLREGTNLAKGRHPGMIGEVECEFRPVDSRWVKHLMGHASWYYEDLEFPVLQAIYPDLRNRFQDEPGFDEGFRQPLMHAAADLTAVEEDFWASTDPNSSLFSWTFPDLPHTRVFLSEAVNSGLEPVTYVSHDRDDGAWQFLGDTMSGGKQPIISCLHHPVDRDPSLKQLADLPVGWWAERVDTSSPWIRHQREDDETSSAG